MEIHRDRVSGRLWLSQYSYVKRVLERFNMDDAKLVSTPLANHFRLSTNQYPKTNDEVKDMSKVPYASAMGCLIYVMVCTRPDLVHIVSVVSKFLSNPGIMHWDAVKWIFRYLKGHTDYGIMFNKQQSDHSVRGYVDADYVGNLDGRRSTTSYVFTLGRRPICWKSMMQSLVALFTTESKYMAIAKVAKELRKQRQCLVKKNTQKRGVNWVFQIFSITTKLNKI